MTRICRLIAACAGVMACVFSVTALAEGLEYPLSVAAAENGTVYIADRMLPGVWKWTDGKLEVYFQASRTLRTPLNAVRCLALDRQGRLLAGDSATRDVYRFEENKPVPLTQGKIGIPMAMAVAPEGDIFVTDLEIPRIVRIPAAGGSPEAFCQVPSPRGAAIDTDGQLWVVSQGQNQLLRISPDGKTIETVVQEGNFQFPHNIILDAAGNAYVADGYARTIWKINAAGTPSRWITGEPLRNPVGLAWRQGDVLIADPRARSIFAADPTGKLSVLVGSSPRE